jgi:vacuolar protein sorting-associated protein 45
MTVLDFTNTVPKSVIERLAEADTHEVVREVQEYFADYVCVNNDLFTLNMGPQDYPLFALDAPTWATNTLTRATEGLSAVLLSLKKKPLIRYERNSMLARKLATELTYTISNEGPLYDFKKPDTPPLLLILDRKNDPITPLLKQWTYQAMVHELLGISNGRVDLSNVKDIKPENKEVVLNAEHDPFYAANMLLNFGDLGANIKEYVNNFQEKHHSSKNIESIEDMKRFVEQYPDFQKLSSNVAKHVTLVSELSKAVTERSLLEVGEMEQQVACYDAHSTQVKAVQRLITDPNIKVQDKLILFALYALRYEKLTGNSISDFSKALQSQGASESRINVILIQIQTLTSRAC